MLTHGKMDRESCRGEEEVDAGQSRGQKGNHESRAVPEHEHVAEEHSAHEADDDDGPQAGSLRDEEQDRAQGLDARGSERNTGSETHPCKEFDIVVKSATENGTAVNL